MADLSELDRSSSTKIAGSDSTGLEDNFANVDVNGNVFVKPYSNGPVTPGAVAAASNLIGGQYNTSLPTLTNTQQAAVQIDSNGRIIVAPTTQGILTEDHNYGTVGVNTLRTAAQIGNATGAADFNAGATGAQTLRVTSNQGTSPWNVQLNGAGSQSEFGALIIGERTNQIEAHFFDTSYLNTMTVTASTGTLSISGGQGTLSSTTATTSSVMARSKSHIMYATGHEVYAMATLAFTIPTSASSYQRWGLYSDTDGFYVGYNGTSFGVGLRKASADTFISKASFNVDTLSGTVGSLFTRNSIPEAIILTDLNLFRIRFGWLGAGTIFYEVFSPDGTWVTFHVNRFPNTSSTVSIQSPNLPITYEVSKTASDATNLQMQTGCTAAGTTVPNAASTYDFSNANLTSLSAYTTPWFDSFAQGTGFNISIASDQPIQYQLQHSPDQSSIKNSQNGGVEASNPFSTTGKAEARYFRIIYTNIGSSTTTTLFLSTMQTKQAEFGTTKISDIGGNLLSITSAGSASVSPPYGTTFADVFDGAGLDLNKWTLSIVGGMTQTQALGVCTLTGDTVASDSISMVSAATYLPVLSNNLIAFYIKTEASIVTNCHRFWGLGTIPDTWTAAAPLLNAIGFEIDTSGNLNIVVYSNGTKIFNFSLNAYKSALQAAENLFFMEIRENIFYFYINGITSPITQTIGYTLDSLLLPLRIHMINSTTPPASAASLFIASAGMGDENPANTTILSDGTYGWRKATIKPGNVPPTITDTALVVTLSPTSAAFLPPSGAGFAFGEITTSSNFSTVPVEKTTYVEQITNATRSIASSSASDTSAGTGARSVIITYLDSTGAGPFTTTVILNGTTYVSTSVSNICFIENMKVASTGSGGVNAGILTLKAATAGSGATIGTIAAVDNQTEWAHHYIPVGKTCYISGFSFSSSSTTTGAGAVFIIKTQNPTVSTSPLIQVSDTCTLAGSIASTTTRTYDSPIKVVGPARITAYVLPASATSTTQRASFDYIDN